MRIENRIQLIWVIVFAILLMSCGSEPEPSSTLTVSKPPSTPSFDLPDQMNDGLTVGSLHHANLDANAIELAISDIDSGKYGEIHSMLIYKNDMLIVEEYFTGHDYSWDAPDFHGSWRTWNSKRRHNVHSVGKSITSACIGIAVDKGHIQSVEQSIFDYLPDYLHLNTSGKGEITIEHLLSMTSGLEWDEWGSSYSDANNDVIALWMDCDDTIACILSKPLVSEPGSDFNYSGGNIVVLGEIIRNATGMDIEAFAGQYLFAPMGIEPPKWPRINDQVIYGGDQRMTPREMLKFGVTYLNDGVWDGQQVVPLQWVEKSATAFPGPDNSWFNSFMKPIPIGESTWGQRGYGYTWWIHEFTHSGEKISAFWAFGWGGQRIIILPDHDTVVVFTGANYTTADPTLQILTQYVIPSLGDIQ